MQLSKEARKESVNLSVKLLKPSDDQISFIYRRAIIHIAWLVRNNFRDQHTRRSFVMDKLEKLASSAALVSHLLDDKTVRRALELGFANRDNSSFSEKIPELLAQKELLYLCKQIVSETDRNLGLTGNTGQKGPWNTIQLPAKTHLVIFSQHIWMLAHGLNQKPKFDAEFENFLSLIWSVAVGKTDDAWRRQLDSAFGKGAAPERMPAHVYTRLEAGDFIESLKIRLSGTRPINRE